MHSADVPSLNTTRKTSIVPRSCTATTSVARPSDPITDDPTTRSPIRAQPAGVSTGASSGCAYPLVTRAISSRLRGMSRSGSCETLLM